MARRSKTPGSGCGVPASSGAAAGEGQAPPVGTFRTILTYHLEGDLETPSAAVFDEVAAQVRLADRLGYAAAWFAEHHFHVHRGHLPNPVLLALHLAGQTRRIRLGSAVITTALHHPLRLAGDLLTADLLTGGRLSIGIGSGSTRSEFAAFGIGEAEQTQAARHGRFAEGLDVLEQAWRGGPVSVHGDYVDVEAPPLLPRAIRPLRDVLWIAANSEGQAELAGRRGYGMMLSRERTPAELDRLTVAFRAGRAAGEGAADGTPGIAASRAVYVGETDDAAREEAAAAVEILVARQRRERPAFANLPPPESFDEACNRVQFVVGGPQTVAAEVRRLGAAVPFTAVHIQPRWQGLAAPLVEASIRRFQEVVVPLAGAG
jgi:alkanesulfonate monooxygenase SsuD/methylene tetrahydromethanopterin reductase-like flavin-dependent oxidoreductase (luciferase family)